MMGRASVVCEALGDIAWSRSYELQHLYHIRARLCIRYSPDRISTGPDGQYNSTVVCLLASVPTLSLGKKRRKRKEKDSKRKKKKRGRGKEERNIILPLFSKTFAVSGTGGDNRLKLISKTYILNTRMSLEGLANLLSKGNN